MGKALVKEFDVEPGVDTLTRWMAHYIADLLTKLEASKGDEKVESQNRCFEAILTLWHHRSFYQDSHRPFENFEPIFRVLESLNLEDGRFFYLGRMGNAPKSLSCEPNNVQEWIDVLRRTDELARILISYSLQKATVEAVDEETIEWLNQSVSLIRDDDLEVIIRLVEGSPIAGDIEALIKNDSGQEKKLRSKLIKLNELIKISDQIKASILRDIETLTNATE